MKNDKFELLGLFGMAAAVLFILVGVVGLFLCQTWKKYYPCEVPVQWMSFDDMQRCAESRGFEVPAL